VGQKHKLGDPTLICKAKITKKRNRSSFHEPNDNMQFNEETIADVSEQVRCSASAWVQKETDPIMHSLKETTDFSVSAKFLSNILSVEMKCVPLTKHCSCSQTVKTLQVYSVKLDMSC